MWRRAALFFLLATCLVAQKAEPLRIEFARGKSSAVLRGHLRGHQEMEYSAAARENQTLTLNLSASPAGGLKLKVADAGGTEVAAKNSTSQRWAARLPKSGEYVITIIRTSDRPQTSTYKLTVTIQ